MPAPAPTTPSIHPKLDLLAANIAAISSFNPPASHEQFLKEEALRLISIAGTLVGSLPNVASNIDERIFSHILLRSLIENFFKIAYVFEDPSFSVERFEEISNGFRREYAKLYNELPAPFQSQIDAPFPVWSSLPKPMDLKSMLAQVRNVMGARLDYLYFIYRIGSFDTHGNSLRVLFTEAFGKSCEFPYLQIAPVIELIADYYLSAFSTISTIELAP